VPYSRTVPAPPASAPAAPASLPWAALRVVGDAAIYRIRRHEANNLLGTLSLLVARGATLTELGVRGFFAILLNLFIYLLNDLFDARLDLESPGKDRAKTEFLVRHRRAAITALAALFLIMLGIAVAHSWILVVALGVNVALDFVYSGWLKRWPFVDLLLTGAWGFSMTLVGVLERDLAVSLSLAGYLGLVSACFQVIQATRDEPADRAAGLRTTANLLGARGARWLFRGLTVATAVYAMALLGSYAAPALLLALLLPLDPARAARSWDLARVLFGVVWLALLLGV
jgi:4-hydroxybenzoate polyprenyltransferase